MTRPIVPPKTYPTRNSAKSTGHRYKPRDAVVLVEKVGDRYEPVTLCATEKDVARLLGIGFKARLRG